MWRRTPAGERCHLERSGFKVITEGPRRRLERLQYASLPAANWFTVGCEPRSGKGPEAKSIRSGLLRSAFHSDRDDGDLGHEDESFDRGTLEIIELQFRRRWCPKPITWQMSKLFGPVKQFISVFGV